MSPLVEAARKTTVAAQSQIWIAGQTQRAVTGALQPYAPLYEKISFAAGDGMVCVKHNIPFEILVEAMGRIVQALVKDQKVTTMISHRSRAILIAICAAEVLDLQDQHLQEKGSPTTKLDFCSKRRKAHCARPGFVTQAGRYLEPL